MAWFYLLLAGLMEVGWAIGLKYTDGFTRFWPSLLTAIAIAASMVFLALALRTLPMGTAYAVWTSIGGPLAALVVLADLEAALQQ